MPLFVVEHRHPSERHPAGNPQMAPLLLELLSKPNAQSHGLSIHGDAVARGQHHRYVIVEGPTEHSVRTYFGPFAQAATLDVVPSSHCEEVVQRGFC